MSDNLYVYYNVLEDRLVVYNVPWLPPKEEYKSSFGGVVVFHVMLIGEL